MKDNEKKGFVVYATLEQQLAFLTDVQVGQLFRAMFVHFRGEEPVIEDLMVKMAFAGVRAIMDIDREKWERTKAARQAAGRKGGVASGQSRREQGSQDAPEYKTSQQIIEEAREAERQRQLAALTASRRLY